VSKLREESRESDQVIGSIFELKIIHAGEVAYMPSRAIGGQFGETREAEFQMSKQGHVWRSGDMVKSGVQQDDTEQGQPYWEDKRCSRM
jgi:hypothetical protein